MYFHSPVIIGGEQIGGYHKKLMNYIPSDRLFAEIYTSYIEAWGEVFDANKLILSSAFPFIKDKLYIPISRLAGGVKGFIQKEEAPRMIEKALKGGNIEKSYVEKFHEDLNRHFVSVVRPRVRIGRMNNEPELFFSEELHISRESGFYFFIDHPEIEKILTSLEYRAISGWGGRRKSGYGKFSIEYEKYSMDREKSEYFILLSRWIPSKSDSTGEGLFLLSYSLGLDSGWNISDSKKKRRRVFVSEGAIFSRKRTGLAVAANIQGTIIRENSILRYYKPFLLPLEVKE